MNRFCLCLLLASVPCAAQDISAYYRMKVGNAPLYRWLTIDSPLQMSLDANKNPHLSIALPPPPPPATFQLNGKLVGALTSLNLIAGPGIILTALSGDAGGLTVQVSLNVTGNLGNGCTVDPQQNLFCQPNGPGSPLPAPVKNAEIAAQESPKAVDGQPGTWELSVVPLIPSQWGPTEGTSCWRNDNHQNPGSDYTLSGKTLTSTSWQIADKLVCDYAYLPVIQPK